MARQKFGAIDGQGVGLMGRSYGIATKGHRLEVLPLREIETQIAGFLDFARNRPDLEFLVTKIGCGLAGYSTEEMQACFVGGEVPENVALPAEFQAGIAHHPSPRWVKTHVSTLRECVTVIGVSSHHWSLHHSP